MAWVKKFYLDFLLNPNKFRVIYILTLFFTSVCFIELPCQILTGVLMLWAILFLLFYPGFLKTRFTPLLISFIFSSLFTALIHIKDNFPFNLIMLYHVCICFFIFYSLPQKLDKIKLRLEMLQVFRVIVISSTILSLLGIIFTIVFTKVQMLKFTLGLRDNRYTGFYTNPNLAAFSSAIAIIFAHYICKEDNAYFPRWFYLLSFLLNILSVFLSDSNDSLLFLTLYLITYVFYLFYKNTKQNQYLSYLFIKIIMLLFLCVFIVFSAFLLRTVCQHLFTTLMTGIHHNQILPPDSNTDGLEDSDIIIIGRGSNYEISSGRLDSLKKALVLYQKNPFFGLGKANILTFGNRYLAKGFRFSDLHNGYLTILVSCGTIGFIIFFSFAICTAIYMIKYLRNTVLIKQSDSFAVLLCSVISYSVFALFEKALLLDITFMVVVFWLILGYSMSMTVETVSEYTLKSHRHFLSNIQEMINQRDPVNIRTKNGLNK